MEPKKTTLPSDAKKRCLSLSPDDSANGKMRDLGFLKYKLGGRHFFVRDGDCYETNNADSTHAFADKLITANYIDAIKSVMVAERLNPLDTDSVVESLSQCVLGKRLVCIYLNNLDEFSDLRYSYEISGKKKVAK